MSGFRVEPLEIRPGDPLKIVARTAGIKEGRTELTTPYPVSADQTLPGFQHNAARKKALMAGWFKSDSALCPPDRERVHSRSYVCRSIDDGQMWSKPERTGVDGAFPSLAVLSADGGRTWTDPTRIDATPYSGYTDVVEVSPGVLLVGYGVSGYLDPVTQSRDKQLRLARVRYERKDPK